MSAFVEAFTRGMQGMDAVSSGACPGCKACAEDQGIRLVDDDGNDRPTEALATELRAMWTSGLMHDAPDFSWVPCGVCGTTLGGDRYVWHWIDPNDPLKAINHESDMCTDCVMFHANGQEPESWRQR